MAARDQGLLHGLYVITDETLMPEARFADMAEQALAGGASIIQYRDKSNDPKKDEKKSLVQPANRRHPW